MRTFYLFFVLIFLTHCGGAILTISPEVQASPPRTLGLLPVEAPSDTQRERVEYIRAALREALKSNGYVVLDDLVLASECSNPSCPEIEQLSGKYRIDSFVSLNIDSISRINFGIGFYNTISGTLSLLNPRRDVLASIKNTEHERGGILFRSGQIFEGISSTVNNTQDDAYTKLTDRFVRTLSLKLPRAPSNEEITKRVNVTITSASISPSKRGSFEICASAPTGLMLSLVLDKNRSPLRSVKEGVYCGTFLLDGLVHASTRLAVEARSPFGISMQRELPTTKLTSCALNGLVQSTSKSMQTIMIGCESASDNEKKAACEERLIGCQTSTFAFYRSPSESGPFTQIGRGTSTLWSDPMPLKDALYAVVAVNPHGSISAPVVPEEGH